MIELSVYEKKWIKLSKNYYSKVYPYTGEWVNTAIPLFEEIYGYEVDKYAHWKYVLFEALLDIHLKIKLDQSGSDRQLKSIFSAAFHKGISNNSNEPIDRAIHTLFGFIQGTRVLNEDGSERFSLDIPKTKIKNNGQ